MHGLQNRAQTSAEPTERNRIIVEEAVAYELKASSAVMHVSVKGASYFADDAALKKAKEVAALVDALKELDIPEQEIRLKNVLAESQSGIISKASSAKYYLSIKCRDLDKLSEALSIVTSAKNCELHSLDWKFLPDRQKKLEQIGIVFANAKETGECIANALGVDIQGVLHCSYEEFTVHDSLFAPTGRSDMISKMNVTPDYEALSRSRSAGPPLPSGQWQKQGIKACVIFEVAENGSSQ